MFLPPFPFSELSSQLGCSIYAPQLWPGDQWCARSFLLAFSNTPHCEQCCSRLWAAILVSGGARVEYPIPIPSYPGRVWGMQKGMGMYPGMV